MTLFSPIKDNGTVINHIWVPAYSDLTANSCSVGTVTMSGTNMVAFGGSRYNYILFSGHVTLGPNVTNQLVEGTAIFTLANPLLANNYRVDVHYEGYSESAYNRILYAFKVTLVYTDDTEFIIAEDNTTYGRYTNATWTFYGTATKQIKAIKFYVKGNDHCSMGIIGMKMYAQKDVECKNHLHYAIAKPKYMKSYGYIPSFRKNNSVTVTTEGIASGFNTSNYIIAGNTNIIPAETNEDTLELIIKFRCSSINGSLQPLFCGYGWVQAGVYGMSGIGLNSSRKVCITENGSISSTGAGKTILDTDAYYWAKLVKTANSMTHSLYLLKDNNYHLYNLPGLNNWTLEASTGAQLFYNSASIYLVLGQQWGGFSATFNGDIDLKGCAYIKNGGAIWKNYGRTISAVESTKDDYDYIEHKRFAIKKGI